MTSRDRRLQRLRPEPLVRQPHPRAARRGGLPTLVRDARHPRGHVEPDDLRQGDGRGRRLRRAAAARCTERATSDRGHVLGRSSLDDIAARRRHPAPVLRRARAAPTASCRSRCRPSSRTTPRRTIAQAAGALFGRLDRPNVMIKIPATPRRAPGDHRGDSPPGINVNVTLIFSLDRYDEVIEAYLEGLEQRVGERRRRRRHRARWRRSSSAGSTPRPTAGCPRATRCAARPRSPTPSSRTSCSATASRGRAGTTLAAAGARVQRPLWASTSTKNPAYSPTLYVDKLIGRDTVNTLAQASIDALARRRRRPARRHGPRRRRRGARQVIADLADAGVDFDDVTATLEREGVDVVRRRRSTTRSPRSRRRRAELTLSRSRRSASTTRAQVRRRSRRGLRVRVQAARCSASRRRARRRSRRGCHPSCARLVDRGAVAGEPDEAHARAVAASARAARRARRPSPYSSRSSSSARAVARFTRSVMPTPCDAQRVERVARRG